MAGRHSAAPDGGARRRARAPQGERAPSQPREPTAGGGRSWKRGSLVLIASVLALFSVAGWSALSSFRAGGCDDGQTLTVAAAPEIAPVVEAAVSPDAGDPLETSQGCGLTVRPTEPADALASIVDGTHAPDLWVPDTSAWLARLPSSVPDRIPRSLAKTPVVLAGPSGGERPDTWLAGLSQPGATLLDPSTTGASIGALEALHAEAVKGATSGTALSHWLVTAAQSAPDYSLGDSEILENAASGLGETSGWFPTTEQ